MELTARKSPTGDAFPGLIVSRSRTPDSEAYLLALENLPSCADEGVDGDFYFDDESSPIQERASDGNGPRRPGLCGRLVYSGARIIYHIYGSPTHLNSITYHMGASGSS